ncbi:unnamed protein product [Brassica rapa]|uniref:Uncharacterized protein n=1 Tax=Brassica campestris TaxID=3711 RepID=A0A8D9DDP9_BRACM|nr:unnamed protein product [Brassica rapa]
MMVHPDKCKHPQAPEAFGVSRNTLLRSGCSFLIEIPLWNVSKDEVILLFHILELCSVEVKLLSTPHDWDLIFRWLPTASPSPVSSRALIQLWHGTIYGLRMERNRRFNIGLSRDEATILNIIVRMIKNKSTALRNLECRFGDDTVSLWSGI